MLRFNIRADVERAQKFYSELDKRATNRAIANALNVVIRSVRTTSIEEIAKIRRVKKSLVRDNVKITQRASNTELRAVVQGTGRPIPLKQYGARQTALGVTVDIKGQRKLIQHAFGPGSNRGKKKRPMVLGGHVFRRTGPRRLPIEPLFGPSIATGFVQRVVRAVQRRLISNEWPKTMNEKLEDQLAKLRDRYGGKPRSP